MKKKKHPAYPEGAACDLRLHCDLEGCRAMPEIHTGLVDEEDPDLGEPDHDHGIYFGTVAVPEIDLSECLRCSKQS